MKKQMNALLTALEPSSSVTSFTSERNGKGTREWSDRSYNICVGCEHGCRYCFAWSQRGRFDPTVRQRGRWEDQKLKERTSLGQNLTTNEVVMFPTTHDITPRFVGKSLTVINNLLADGNKVLIVTKPHLSVVQRLCRELGDQKHMILFRFTIGALDPELCAYWEPYAPSPLERAKALRHAFAQGFSTSVSIEPMLGSVDETIQLVGLQSSYVTDTLWIGKMQRIPKKLNAHVPGFVAARELVRVRQTDAEILRLVDHLNQHSKVRWKDSTKAVISRKSKTAPNN